jgi:hypothetical protein
VGSSPFHRGCGRTRTHAAGARNAEARAAGVVAGAAARWPGERLAAGRENGGLSRQDTGEPARSGCLRGGGIRDKSGSGLMIWRRSAAQRRLCAKSARGKSGLAHNARSWSLFRQPPSSHALRHRSRTPEPLQGSATLPDWTLDHPQGPVMGAWGVCRAPTRSPFESRRFLARHDTPEPERAARRRAPGIASVRRHISSSGRSGRDDVDPDRRRL